MPKYQIGVQWHYRAFDYTQVEIEADSLEAAKEKALALNAAGKIQDWQDGQIYDGESQINEDECFEVKS